MFQVGRSLVCLRKGIPQSRAHVSNRVSANGTSGNRVVNVEVKRSSQAAVYSVKPCLKSVLELGSGRLSTLTLPVFVS